MSSTDDIDSTKQDAKWYASKLVAVGAVALAAALAIIYTLATVIGASDVTRGT